MVRRPPPAGTAAGDRAVSALRTPFYLAFKAAACAASAAIAAPVAGIAGLATGPRAEQTLKELGDGLAANCGPPYVLTPPEAIGPPPAVE